jgi:hypothetical protein
MFQESSHHRSSRHRKTCGFLGQLKRDLGMRGEVVHNFRRTLRRHNRPREHLGELRHAGGGHRGGPCGQHRVIIGQRLTGGDLSHPVRGRGLLIRLGVFALRAFAGFGVLVVLQPRHRPLFDVILVRAAVVLGQPVVIRRERELFRLGNGLGARFDLRLSASASSASSLAARSSAALVLRSASPRSQIRRSSEPFFGFGANLPASSRGCVVGSGVSVTASALAETPSAPAAGSVRSPPSAGASPDRRFHRSSVPLRSLTMRGRRRHPPCWFRSRTRRVRWRCSSRGRLEPFGTFQQ